MKRELQGRVAIVTGGAQGIGRAICTTLARQGARLVINYRTSEREARRLARDLGKFSEAAALRGDVSDPGDVQRMVSAARREFGRVDILVNNASYSSPASWKASLEDLSLAEWERTLQVDLKGTLLCSKAVAPFMRRQRRGKIVNFTASSALWGDPETLLYAAAKMGIVGLTRAMARSLAPHIQVNAVAPGSVRTRWVEEWRLTRRDLDSILRSTPAGRIGEPEEVAEVVLFLASDRSDFVTGQTWIVDGGVTTI
ncbi:MAG: 3-oxoacyl-ACP reductase FabG [Euryarchaeota archaeon]|nr:3-oxoacyl-ACP reductase FabG [Euryarchaeota archaeon]